MASEMNWITCNKCFAPLYRGKRPYVITQCGHISCQNCLQQVEQPQCPQCQRGTMSLALEEPLKPRLIPYFQPLGEILEMQSKVNMFWSNQMKILMHHFTELDKKYELLKTRFWLTQRNFKALTDKYT
ncbi:probable E3 SUMO-protein ligase RNF212 [Temnothorax longispinosus]|uniref:probable E3 SUMO-protein ligase RNF212 n=1 Tax=Temnothorax longispinosus TaxID=300112 RepID=UPI003A9939A8